MNIKLKSLFIENFKGIKEKKIDFSDKTNIKGANAVGKTTVFDSFTWLLFNKNSAGEEKFQVRTLDANGKPVHNTEIKVVATLVVDGKEVELSKTQKENWVKKRGTDTATLQGNVNSFEVDGYPKSEKEYKEFISNLVAEDLFKMLTNPQYFVSMKWKDQRDILMKFVTEMTDLELAQEDEQFSGLISELEKAPSTDDIKNKFQKALTEWKKKQTEIPVRIDELSKQKVDIDVAEQELAKNDLVRRIEEIDRKIAAGNNGLAELEQEELQIQFDMSGIKQTMNRDLSEKRRDLENKIYEEEKKFKEMHLSVCTSESMLEADKKKISELEARKDPIKVKFNANKASVFDETQYLFDESKWVFDESTTVCSLCGQTLPEDRINSLRDEFEQKKSKAKANMEEALERERDEFTENKNRVHATLMSESKQLVADLEALEKSNKELEAKISEQKQEEVKLMENKNVLSKQLQEIPEEANYAENTKYVELEAKWNDIHGKIEELKKEENPSESYKIERTGLVIDLDNVKATIAKSENNVAIDERIEELEEEQRQVGQKVADQEKMLYLLEQFIKAKMMKISETINSKFKTVDWKLFETQINGGLKECCECTVNGVPFSTLNSGHRIVAGLDIISSLSALYDAEAPIFIDNCEAVSDGNLPEMKTQMICLYVDECKELMVSGI